MSKRDAERSAISNLILAKQARGDPAAGVVNNLLGQANPKELRTCVTPS